MEWLKAVGLESTMYLRDLRPEDIELGQLSRKPGGPNDEFTQTGEQRRTNSITEKYSRAMRSDLMWKYRCEVIKDA